MKKIFIIFLLIGFTNNLFAKDKPQAGIFIENYDGMIIHGHPTPGITNLRYYFGHRWDYRDFNNDGIKDFLYSGTMRPTNINTTGEDTSGACGGKKCEGDMPGPTLYLGQKDGTFVDNSKLIIDKREPSGQSLSRQQLIADFNNDGFLDIYIADHGIGGGNHDGFRDSYFLSQKDGTWLESSSTHLSKKIFKIFDHGGAIGDIDNDGDIDIVLTDLERVLRCLINDGTGKMKIKKCGSINAFGIELGDFDNDGDLDIISSVVGMYYSGSAWVVYENKNGKLELVDVNIILPPLDEWQDPKIWGQMVQTETTQWNTYCNKSILIDVNSDGLMDALCSNVAQDFKSANLFLLNKGNMQFDVLNPDQVNRWVDWLE